VPPRLNDRAGPRKPIPVTTCAAMRPGSPGCPGRRLEATCPDSHMNSIEPRQIRMLVRKPAGFFLISRSTPMRPPHAIARNALGRNSLATGQSSRAKSNIRRSRSPGGPGARLYNYIPPHRDATTGPAPSIERWNESTPDRSGDGARGARAALRLKPGERVTPGVVRGGLRLDRDLVLGEPPASARRPDRPPE